MASYEYTVYGIYFLVLGINTVAVDESNQEIFNLIALLKFIHRDATGWKTKNWNQSDVYIWQFSAKIFYIL